MLSKLGIFSLENRVLIEEILYKVMKAMNASWRNIKYIFQNVNQMLTNKIRISQVKTHTKYIVLFSGVRMSQKYVVDVRCLYGKSTGIQGTEIYKELLYMQEFPKMDVVSWFESEYCVKNFREKRLYIWLLWMLATKYRRIFPLHSMPGHEPLLLI